MSEEPIQQSSQPSPSPGSSQPAPQSQPSQTSASQPSVSQPGTQAQQQASAQSAAFNWREEARAHGLDLSRYQDDREALRAIAQGVQQAQRMAPLAQAGQQYLQYATEFEEWRKHREQYARAQQAQQQQGWWQPPEFDPRWRNQVVRDEQGNLVPAAGAPPDVAAKFQRYAAWLTDQQDRFWSNPVETIKPGLVQAIAPLVQQAIQQHLSQYRDQNTAQQYVQQNSGWLFQRGQDGSVAVSPDGRPVLSPAGQQFAFYVRQAEQFGVAGVENMRRYAQGMVERDYAVQQWQQQTSQSAGQQQKDEFVAQAAAQNNPNVGASRLRQQRGRAIVEHPAGVPLAERLRKDLANAGITDQAIMNGE